MRQLYRSSNGDKWFLIRDPVTGGAFVRHQANTPSGGQVTDIPIAGFLSGPRNPEHEALLRLIGTSLPNAHEAAPASEETTETAGEEWCRAVRAGRLDYVRTLDTGDCTASRPGAGGCQNKVVEIGRSCGYE
jgi:hypothetical protein